MAITPVKSYRLTKETLDRLDALKQKLGVKYDNTVIEMAVKRMADQEQIGNGNKEGGKRKVSAK